MLPGFIITNIFYQIVHFSLSKLDSIFISSLSFMKMYFIKYEE